MINDLQWHCGMILFLSLLANVSDVHGETLAFGDGSQ